MLDRVIKDKNSSIQNYILCELLAKTVIKVNILGFYQKHTE